MKLGANSVLFGGYDMETAFKYLAMAGYDGIELSAIDGMSSHLVLDNWRDLVPEIKRLSQVYGLELLAIEQPSQRRSQDGAGHAGCRSARHPHCQLRPRWQVRRRRQPPAVDRRSGQLVPAGGEVRRDPVRQGARRPVRLQHADHAADYGRHHPHLPSASTWTLRTFIARARTRSRRSPPSSAASSTSTFATARDASRAPASRKMQANGRGDIDLVGYVRVLHEHGYTGPLNLEIIGAKEYSVEQCCVIAAESRGHMQACLQACGAR